MNGMWTAFNVITVSGKKQTGTRYIFAFMEDMSQRRQHPHRRIIEELVKMYGLKVDFYRLSPLAPEHTYEKNTMKS